jgi:hypothetical protein
MSAKYGAIVTIQPPLEHLVPLLLECNSVAVRHRRRIEEFHGLTRVKFTDAACTTCISSKSNLFKYLEKIKRARIRFGLMCRRTEDCTFSRALTGGSLLHG